MLITLVSCSIRAVGNNAEIKGARLGVLTASSQLVRLKELLPNLIFTAAGNTERIYVVSQPIRLLVAVNRPALVVFLSADADTIDLECQIAGTISPP